MYKVRASVAIICAIVCGCMASAEAADLTLPTSVTTVTTYGPSNTTSAAAAGTTIASPANVTIKAGRLIINPGTAGFHIASGAAFHCQLVPYFPSAPTVTPSPVTGTTATVAVAAVQWYLGEGTVTYAWSKTSGPGTATFSATGTNAAKSATVTFSASGTYVLTVTATAADGSANSYAVTVTVNATATSLVVTPASATTVRGGLVAFGGDLRNQFAASIAAQPALTWTTTGGGSFLPTGSHVLEASGADIWGTADGFRFEHQELNGDGSIIAKVEQVENTNAWAKAGVMMRDGTGANVINAAISVTPSSGVVFQRRLAVGAATTNNIAAGLTAPYWVKLTRAGNTLTGFSSPDGATWTQVGTDTVTMAATLRVGLSLTAHQDGVRTQALFSNVSVVPASAVAGALPSGWTQADYGITTPVGTGTYTPSTRTYTVQAAGADIWGTSDGFHLLSQPLPAGDVTLIARVASLVNTNANAKAGLMIRDGLGLDARNAFVDLTATSGVAFQRRLATTGSTTSTTIGGLGAPRWLKLVRSGTLFTGYASADGLSWTRIGSDTVTMGATVYAGLAVTSHNATTLTTAVFDSVQILTGTSAAVTSQWPWQTQDIGTVALAGSAVTTTLPGVFLAGGTLGGPYTVTATGGGKSGTATVTITNGTPIISIAAKSSTSPVTGTTTTLTAYGDDDAGEPGLTYAWSTTSAPATPAYSVNGTNAAKTTTATFSQSGSYTFRVIATDANGTSSAPSDVTVSVTLIQPQTISFPAIAARTYGAAPFGLAATASSGLPVSFSVISGPAVWNGSLLTVTGIGTVTIAANQAGNASYLAAPQVTQSFVVAPAVLTVTAGNASRVYGAANPIFTSNVSGLVNGDTASVITGSATLASTATTTSSAGTYPITVATSGMSAANYTFSGVSGTLTVTKAVLTVTANNTSRAYGAVNPSFTWTGTGYKNGDTAGVVTGTATYTTPAVATSVVGTYAITPVVTTLVATNYSFTPVNGTLTVSAAVLTVTADATSREYGVANPALMATITGYQNGQTSSVVTDTPTLSTAATLTSAVGAYAITTTVTGMSAPNYSIVAANGTLTVTKAPLTVTVANASRIYGSANPTFTSTIAGFRNGDLATVVTGSTTYTTPAVATSAVGTYAITPVVTALVATNYSFTPVNGTLTVTKAVLTVTANNTSRAYGAVNPSFTWTGTGYKNGDTSAVVTGTATYTTPAVATSAVGTYAITPVVTALVATNYSFTPVNGTLTVTAAVLTVTADAKSREYGVANPGQLATITGYQNGQTSSVVTGTPTLSTAATTTSAVGAYAITTVVTGMSAPNYSIVAANGTLTVTKAPLTVTVANASRIYGSANPTFSSTIAGFRNGDLATVVTGSTTYTTPAVATSAVGTYAVTPVVTALVATNYSFTPVNGTLTVTKASLTVTANNTSRAYGAANPAFTWTGTGYLNGDTSAAVTGTVTYTTPAVATSAVGTYAITPVVTALVATNYSFTPVNGTLTVSAAVLTVTADAKSRAYGVANPAFTWTVTGYKNGETSSVITGLPTLATSATTTSPTGTYPITVATNGMTAVNYTFTGVPGVLTISASSPTITSISPATGPVAGATSVTIFGTNLTGTTSVTFGGASATIVSNTATQIDATVPAHAAGAVNVVVTTPNGSATSTNGYTYLTPPAITTQPLSQSVAVGAVATFSVVASGTPTLSYQWSKSTDGGTIWSSVTGATSSTYLPPAALASDHGTKFRCQVTNGAGQATSNVATLTVVNGAPIAVATSTFPYGTAPYTMTFNGAGSSDPNGDPLTYSWSVYTAGGSSTASSFSHTFTTPGEYEVWLTVSDGRSWTSTMILVTISAEVVNRITVPTTITAADLSYDNEVLVVDATTLTVVGPHTFAAGYVINNGTITSDATTAVAENRLDMSFTRNLTIAVGSTVDVSAKGYLPGYTVGNTTTGAATTYAGGSHGGYGLSYSDGVRNEVYGSFLTPTDLGAGSGGAPSGCAGGGAIHLTAAKLDIRGTIRANGGGTTSSRGGAGGSIWLQTGEIDGSGLISANGGGGTSYGLGGGGRIACYYQFADTGDLKVIPTRFTAIGAQTGTGTGYNAAGHGSIYLKKSDISYPQVVWKNNGLRSVEATPWWFGARNTTLDDPATFEAELVTGGQGSVTYESSPCVLTAQGFQPTIQDTWFETQRLDAQSLSLLTSAVLWSHETTAASEQRLELNLVSTLTIDATSKIDVTGRGFLPGYTVGNTTTNGATKNAGGSYGGYGAINKDSSGFPDQINYGIRNEVYGSYLTPTDLGSGGGIAQSGTVYAAPGGGAVRITAGTIINDGSILADAADNRKGIRWQFVGICGSGGSILIYTNGWSGSGTLSANGGIGNSSCGGGGRIALYYASGTPTLSTFNVLGGIRTSSSYDPVAGHGTVFCKLDSLSYGTLYASNGGARAYEATPVWFGSRSSTADDPAQYLVNLQISGKAWLDIASTTTELQLFGAAPVLSDSWLVADKITAASWSLVQNAWVSCHPTTASLEVRQRIAITGALSIDATSAIDVSARGYLAGRTIGNLTSGAATKRAGGSYGGLGTVAIGGTTPDTIDYGIRNDVYGDFSNPTDLGSGGGPELYQTNPQTNGGMSGGGAIYLTASSLTMNGKIMADGEDYLHPGTYSFYSQSSGSGGSIKIEVGTWSGTGITSAKGGSGTHSGGGGRIAVQYVSGTAPNPVSFTAAGGCYTSTTQINPAGHGTVFIKRQADGSGILKIDNGGYRSLDPTPMWFGVRTDAGDDPATYGVELVTGGKAYLILEGTARLQMLGSSPTIRDAWIMLERITASSLLLQANAALISPSSTPSAERKIDVAITNLLTLDVTSRIDAVETGYNAEYTKNNTKNGGATGYAGGSYGGRGFIAIYQPGAPGQSNASYGTFDVPVDLGSGSGPLPATYGRSGGGCITITTASIINDGRITADGMVLNSFVYQQGRGSGGSVMINTTALSGTGVVSAVGGMGSYPGGGGRISVWYNQGDPTQWNMSAKGGLYTSGKFATDDVAGAGTIFLRNRNINGAYLRVDNGGNLTALSTPIWFGPRTAPLSTYTVPLYLEVTGGALVNIEGGLTTLDAFLDTDNDGLTDYRELLLGLNPSDPDSNHDGIPDGVEVGMGINAISTDTDGDGVPNAVEIANHTDPLRADTDGDGVSDGLDAFPNDPGRTTATPIVPGDVTPPTITLLVPSDALPLN